MIDLYCHSLPEVDARPKNVERSIEIAKEIDKHGIYKIVAAPLQ